MLYARKSCILDEDQQTSVCRRHAGYYEKQNGSYSSQNLRIPKYEVKKLMKGDADFKSRDKTTTCQYRSV